MSTALMTERHTGGKIGHKCRGRAPATKPDPGNRFQRLPNGDYVADLDIEVDVEAIVKHLGRKAILNKSKRSAIGPYIKVKARNVRHDGGS